MSISTVEKILHIQSPADATEFTISLEPAIYFNKHHTLAVYISLLEFSATNTFTTGSAEASAQYESFFVNCSLSNDTVSLNGKPSNVLESIMVEENLKMIRYTNYNPIRLNVSAATIGTTLSHITFWLTDANNDKVDITISSAGTESKGWRAKLLLEIMEER